MQNYENIQNFLSAYQNLLKSQKTILADLKKAQIEAANLCRTLNEQELTHFAILGVYYSTNLTVKEIIEIKTEDLERENNYKFRINIKGPRGRSITLNTTISQILSKYLSKRIYPYRSLFINPATRKPFKAPEIFEILKNHLPSKLNEELSLFYPIKKKTDFSILPTPLRLNANPKFTGRNITIAFIDSGFYPHPDLVKPVRRILAYKHFGEVNAHKSDLEKPDISSWHGMQTSVVAAGNGYLSKGLYRGIASSANVVLLKISGKSLETYSQNIVKAFEWIIKKKDIYKIKVVNISLGINDVAPLYQSEINQAAEEAVQAGIVVVAAAGNDGNSNEPGVTAPASAPSIITVGGVNDNNSVYTEKVQMYWSSFGETPEGILKPEIIAPGIWVAAPILPTTNLFQLGTLLLKLDSVSDKNLKKEIKPFLKLLELKKEALKWENSSIRAHLKALLIKHKIIAAHYQHVDGTSFSSPIVASIVAQMLEADPALTPSQVKEILINTATRLPWLPMERQGFGVVNAAEAVNVVVSGKINRRKKQINYPIVKENSVTFRFYDIDKKIKSVSVAGTFNNWNPEKNKLIRSKTSPHIFELSIDIPYPGRHQYKFVIDEKVWITDPINPRKIPDRIGGYNSYFEIYSYIFTSTVLEKIEEVLCKNPPVIITPGKKPKFNPERSEALARLDKILLLPSISKCKSIKKFYLKKIKKALSFLNETEPDEKTCFICQFYSAGFIIKTSTITIGFDIVTGEHVWSLYWDIPEEITSSLTQVIDVMFISHKHADHLDIDFANKLIEEDKLVICPRSYTDLLKRGVVGFSSNETREYWGIGKNNTYLKISSFKAVHTGDRKAKIPLLYYVIKTAENIKIAHITDVNYTKTKFKRKHKLNILIANPLNTDEDLKNSKNLNFLVKKFPHTIFIPAHLSEIGRPMDIGGRLSYLSTIELLESLKLNFSVLSWGEVLRLSF